MNAIPSFEKLAYMFVIVYKELTTNQQMNPKSELLNGY